jgi:hypothetical protein
MSMAVAVSRARKSHANHVGFLSFVLLTALSAIYDPASWPLGTFGAPALSSIGAAMPVPLGWGLLFCPTTLEQDNGTGRIEVAKHRCR